jgi:hypothetical protein
MTRRPNMFFLDNNNHLIVCAEIDIEFPLFLACQFHGAILIKLSVPYLCTVYTCEISMYCRMASRDNNNKMISALFVGCLRIKSIRLLA